MKNRLVFFCVLVLVSAKLLSQQGKDPKIPLIGSDAPTFTAISTNGTITFPDDYGNKGRSCSVIQRTIRRMFFRTIGIGPDAG